jgi:hypothetical protein
MINVDDVDDDNDDNDYDSYCNIFSLNFIFEYINYLLIKNFCVS